MIAPDGRFPEGTVTIRLHRRKPQHILMDRRDVDLVLAEELEMQRTENKHLRRKLGEQARYLAELERQITRWRKAVNWLRGALHNEAHSGTQGYSSAPSVDNCTEWECMRAREILEEVPPWESSEEQA